MLTFKVESTLSLCMLGCNVFSEFIPGNWVRDTAMIEFFVSVFLRCWHHLRTLLFIKIYSCMLRVLSKKKCIFTFGSMMKTIGVPVCMLLVMKFISYRICLRQLRP